MASPAETVVDRLGDGSIAAAARALDLHRSSVKRWLEEPPRGTGGLIPSQHQARILEIARERGINLTAEHLIVGTR